MTNCLPAALLLASCAAAPAGPTPQSADTNAQRVSFYLGQRSLDEDAYAPVEDQATFGIEYANEKDGSFIGWELGLMGSRDEESFLGFDIVAGTGEVYGGVRKTFFDSTKVVRPYIGGGGSYITSRVEVAGADEDDGSIAGYAHGGVLFDLTQAFFLGVDLRFLFGSDLEIAGVNTDADYAQGALVLGVSF